MSYKEEEIDRGNPFAHTLLIFCEKEQTVKEKGTLAN